MDMQKYLYKSPNHLTNLNEVRLTGKLCDVIIKADDKEVPAHKLILAANLKYFESMFLSEFQESKQNVIEMEGIEGTHLEAFITYAYTGEILITDDNALNLLEVANYLNEDGIREACIEFLKKHLKEAEACRVYQFANAIDCFSLKTQARQIILSHFKDCSQTTDYLDLDFENLNDILTHASSEFSKKQRMCFESVMKWIIHDVKDRSIYINDILSLIDMSKLGTDYLLQYFCKSIGNQEYGDVTKKVMSFYFENGQYVKPQIKESKQDLKQNLMIVGGVDKKLHFQLYDFEKKSWSAPEEMTHPDLQLNGYIWNCGAILNNKFYYMIADWSKKYLRAFDPTTKKSVMLASDSRLLRYAAICSDRKFIYFCGGQNDDKTFSDQILKYDPQKNSFDSLTSMGTKRSNATAIFYRGLLHVLGGKNEESKSLGVVEKYYPNAKIWTEMSPMNQPRSSLRAAILNEKLYACGGWPRSVVEVYDPSTKKWQMFYKMDRLRSDLLVVVYKGQMMAVGGSNSFTAEIYNSSKDMWKTGTFPGLRIAFGTGGLVSFDNCTNISKETNE